MLPIAIVEAQVLLTKERMLQRLLGSRVQVVKKEENFERVSVNNLHPENNNNNK